MSENKTKQLLQQLCQEMARNPHIMTKEDIVQAAIAGATWGQDINQPLLGAVLGVSVEASRRAGLLAKDLIQDLSSKKTVAADEVTAPPQMPKLKLK